MLTKEQIAWSQKTIRGIITITTKVKDEAELSDKAKKIVALINDRGSFGCQTAGVRELCSIMLGETLPIRSGLDKEAVLSGTVLVLLTNPNGHNYPLNKPVFVHSGDMGLYTIEDKGAACFHVGNHIPRRDDHVDTDGPAWREATEDEVRSFIENASRFPRFQTEINGAMHRVMDSLGLSY